MYKCETRRCPEGHVEYEINPYTFSYGVLNADKYFCPVCGRRLEIEEWEVPDSCWTSDS